LFGEVEVPVFEDGSAVDGIFEWSIPDMPAIPDIPGFLAGAATALFKSRQDPTGLSSNGL